MSNDENDKAALYARVSTEKQRLDQQKDALKKYAERKGYDWELFEEKVSTRKKRPKRQECIRRAKQGEFDALIVYKLDRFGRSTQELINDITELDERGVEFISVSDDIDLGTSTGRLQFQIIAAFAEFERNLISERTKEGMAASDNKPGPEKYDFNQRRAAYMLFEEDASYREVAEELGISKTTVGRFKKDVEQNPPDFIKEVVGTFSDENETGPDNG